MSNQKIVEVRSNDPAVNASIQIVADLVSRGIPFVAVPCFTVEQVDAASAMGLKHFADAAEEASNSAGTLTSQ